MGCEPSQQNGDNAEKPTQRYQRQELKAQGTHSKLYKAYDTTRQKQCAQKMLQKLPSSGVQAMQPNLQDYFSRLASLKHQNVLSYSDMFFSEGILSIIMEFCQEGTLAQHIQSRGRLREFQSAKILRKVLSALQYLHHQGLLHNDLKPSNILLFQNTLRITDYCLAQLFDARLRSGQHKQPDDSNWTNVPYMAPEVVKNLGTSKLADVWSVGCVLIEMLTGKRPWATLGSQEEIFKKIAAGPVPPLPTQISATCTSFLQNCLAIVPSQRSSVRQLLNHPFLLLNKQKLVQKEELRNTQVVKVNENQHFSMKNTIEESEIAPIADKKPVVIAAKKEKQIKASNGRLSRINKAVETQAFAERRDKKNQSNFQVLDYEHQPQEENTVILNNRKVKLSTQLYRSINPQRFSTDAAQWISPSRVKINEVKRSNGKGWKDEGMDQIDLLLANNSAFSENSRLVLPEINPSQKSKQQSRLRTKTQAFDQTDRQYYKKPLQLLKQKIQERKVHRQFQERMQTQLRKYSAVNQNQIFLQEELSEKQDSDYYNNSASNRDDAIIDTEVARLERDIFHNNQKIMFQKRKEERLKWQNELKSGKEMLKKEAPFRYYIK